MIKHIWSILAQSSSIDNDTNDLSIFNILNNLVVFAEAGSEINLPIKFEIVSLWERSEDEVPEHANSRIMFIDPNGSSKLMFKNTLEISKTHFLRTRVRFPGMTLFHPGRYRIKIELKEAENKRWKKVCEIPFLVSFNAPKEAREESR